MPEWIVYLLKFNLSLALVWLFYHVFLRRLTFYNWNRTYLLIYSAVCFLIPFININPWLNSSGMVNLGIVHNIPSVSHYVHGPETITSVNGVKLGYPFLLGVVLLVGSLVMGLRLLVMYISLLRISNKAKLLVEEPVQIFETSQNVSPFSFGKKIFIQPDALPGEELETIIRHEFIHVKQRHSFDIIYSEFLCIIAWYNPFAWLIRHAIRQNLEFIADNMILNNGTDKKAYQYLLLKVTGQAPISISNQFNLSSLKNRMVMMNKSKSAKTQLLKFLLSLPVVVILLMAFRNAGENIIPSLLRKNVILTTTDTVPPSKPTQPKSKPAPPPAKIANSIPPPPKPLPQVVNITIDKNAKATVVLKNGKKEYYDFNKPEEGKAFQKKYGNFPPSAPMAVEVEPGEIAEVPAATAVTAEVPAPVTTKISVASSPVVASVASPSKASVSAAPAEEEEISMDIKGDVLINLTPRSTQVDVDKQVEKLKAKGYFVEISNLVWKQGKLILVEGSMAGKKKKVQFKAADFKEIIFTSTDDKDSETGIQFYVVKGMLSIN